MIVVRREPVGRAGKQWQVTRGIGKRGFESAVCFVAAVELEQRDHFARACGVVFWIGCELFVVECKCFLGLA